VLFSILSTGLVTLLVDSFVPEVTNNPVAIKLMNSTITDEFILDGTSPSIKRSQPVTSKDTGVNRRIGVPKIMCSA